MISRSIAKVMHARGVKNHSSECYEGIYRKGEGDHARKNNSNMR